MKHHVTAPTKIHSSLFATIRQAINEIKSDPYDFVGTDDPRNFDNFAMLIDFDQETIRIINDETEQTMVKVHF